MCHYGGAVVACSTDKSIKVRSDKDIGRISLKRGGGRDMQGCFIVRIIMNYPFVLEQGRRSYAP